MVVILGEDFEPIILNEFLSPFNRLHASWNSKELLSLYSREPFLKYQDCQYTYSVRFCMTKLQMLASNVDFI